MLYLPARQRAAISKHHVAEHHPLGSSCATRKPPWGLMSLNLILIHHFQKAHRELLSQAPAKHNRLEANDWLEALPRCPISVVAARANNNTRSGFRTHLAISYLAWLPIGTAKTHARAAGLWLLDNSPTRPSKRNNMTVRLCKHPFLPVLPLNLIPKCAFVSNGGEGPPSRQQRNVSSRYSCARPQPSDGKCEGGKKYGICARACLSSKL